MLCIVICNFESEMIHFKHGQLLLKKDFYYNFFFFHVVILFHFKGCTIVTKVMTKAWLFPKISHDLAYALCDYLRDQNYFDILIGWFVKPVTCESGKAIFF